MDTPLPVEYEIYNYARILKERADQDYITARMCYFHGLHENFLWNALQCIEKYFKAIALRNNIDIRKCGHDLDKLLTKITSKLPILETVSTYWKNLPEPILPEGVAPECFEQFLTRLTTLGMNRYVSHNWRTRGNELQKVDATVASIRGYCHPQDSNPYTHATSSFKLGTPTQQKSLWLTRGNLYLADHDEHTIFRSLSAQNHPIAILYKNAQDGTKEQKSLFIKVTERILSLLYFPTQQKEDLQQRVEEQEQAIANIDTSQDTLRP